MKTLLKALVILPLAVVIVLLSVSNRELVTVSLDPFSGQVPAVALTAPLFAVILGAVMVGVLVGGVAVWWSQGRFRRAAREKERELRRVRAEAPHAAAEAAGHKSGVPARLGAA